MRITGRARATAVYAQGQPPNSWATVAHSPVRCAPQTGSMSPMIWPMGTARKSRRLRKESSICERHREISICLALNHDAAVDAVVTDLEAIHPYIDVGTRAREIE